MQSIVFGQTTDTVSVMFYNLLKFPQENASRITNLESILQESLPDLLMVCELTSASGANAVLNSALNVNGISYYDKSAYVPGPDMENMIYFNSNKLGLVEQNVIPTAVRDINEYVLYYKSDDIATILDTTFYYVYVCHLKASQSDSILRNSMAIDMKEYMATRSSIENIILGGDFNVYTSSEPAWHTVLNGEGVPLVDPISSPGSWHIDFGYSDIHTQSTRTTSFGTGATGGMDDRFDFIFISPDLENWGNQAKYVDNSYWAYGQDGNHFDIAFIDSPLNTTLPSNIIQDLYEMSDHLPVYLEIEVQKSFNEIEEKSTGLKIYFDRLNGRIRFVIEKDNLGLEEGYIYDFSGKLIMVLDAIDVQAGIDVSELEKGSYLFVSKDYHHHLKFVR